MYNVLIADKLPDSALKLIRTNSKYHINLITGLSESDLIKKIPAYHARSSHRHILAVQPKNRRKELGKILSYRLWNFWKHNMFLYKE